MTMIKLLSGAIREYKRASLLAPFFVILEVLMEVLIPFVMASLIDNGIEAGNLPYVAKIGLVLILMALASLIFGILSGKNAAIASAGFAKNLRKDIYYNVQSFSFNNIDKFSTSSIVTRLTTDITNVQNAYMMIVRIAVRCPVMLVLSLFMVLKISPKLSIIFLCAIPILGVGLYLIMSHAYPAFRKMFKTYDRMNQVVQENLYGIRVVKSFVREDHEREKFNDVSEQIYQLNSKAERLLSFTMPLMMFVVYAGMLLLSWFGAREVVFGGLQTGELNSMFTYTMQILMSLMMLAMVFVMIVMSKASAERICEVLLEKSDLTNPPHPVTEVKDGSIRFDHVSFSYSGDPNKLCMKDINLEIPSGTTVGILGGTGSAKSTLVKLIPRLYDATTGTVSVGGVDVRDYDLETLRNAVAMVLQKNELFSGTIKENLRWGDENATDAELVHACELAQADSFIQEFPDGYDTYIEQGGTNVSGGQKQRLCIARALLKKPKILILDDSTSAVDTATDAKIRQAFRSYIPETTKIIIAQRISSVQEADMILVLNNGTIDAIGTHETLLKSNQIYREVYESQQKGSDDQNA